MGDGATLARFSEACGLTGPLRLIVERPGVPGSEVRELRGPFAMIGRDATMDLVLDHPEVSRRHAYLQVISGRIYILDLASRTGLYWADGRRPGGWIGPGQGVKVGPFLIQPQLEDASATAEAPPPTSRSFPVDGTTAIALDYSGPDPMRGTWQVSRALVVLGRSNACRVQLPGPNVSAFHAALVRTRAGAWILDLLTPSGIAVNGGKVRCALFQEGDSIRVGPHRIGVHLGIRAPLALTADRLPSPVAAQSLATRTTAPDPLLASVVEEFARMKEQMADQLQQSRMMQDQMGDQFQQALMTMFRLFSGMHQDQMDLIREEFNRLHDLNEEQRSIQARLSVPTPPVAAENSLLRLVPAPPSSSQPAVPPPAVPANEPALPRPVRDPTQADIHLVLMQRLATISGERQGRWQKLLNMMLGKGSEQASS